MADIEPPDQGRASTSAPAYPCPDCSKAFKTKRGLATHASRCVDVRTSAEETGAVGPPLSSPPAIRAVRGRLGEWIRLIELAQVVDAEDLRAFADRKKSLACTWDVDTPVACGKRTRGASATSEPFARLADVRRAFALVRLGDDLDSKPEHTTYRMLSAGLHDVRAWLPSTYLLEVLEMEEVEVEALVESGFRTKSTKRESEAQFARVKPGRLAERTTRGTLGGYWFFDAAHVVSKHPDHMARIHALVAPDSRPQPVLPAYEVGGTAPEERYIPGTCFRRACLSAGGRLREMFVGEHEDKTDARVFGEGGLLRRGDTIAANRLPDGSLVAIGQGNVCGSVMVSTRVLRRAPFDALGGLCAPAVPGLPIERSAPPTRDRAGCCDTRRARAPKSTVKCGLRRRIADKRAAAELVEYVARISLMSRHASLLLNLHVARLLEEGNGSFGADAPTIDTTFVFNAMAFARTGRRPSGTKYVALAETVAADADALTSYAVPFDEGATNSIVYEARQYVTSFHNAVSQHGGNYLARVFRRAAVLEGTAIDMPALMGHVRSGASLAQDSTHPRLVSIATKYRIVYVEKGLSGDDGFDVNALSGNAQDSKVARILELYRLLNTDLRALENEAVASGRWLRAGQDDDDDDDPPRAPHDDAAKVR